MKLTMQTPTDIHVEHVAPLLLKGVSLQVTADDDGVITPVTVYVGTSSPSPMLLDVELQDIATEIARRLGNDALVDKTVAALDAIGSGDPEIAHGGADNILLDTVDPRVSDAYSRLVQRCGWWVTA